MRRRRGAHEFGACSETDLLLVGFELFLHDYRGVGGADVVVCGRKIPRCANLGRGLEGRRAHLDVSGREADVVFGRIGVGIDERQGTSSRDGRRWA